MQPDRGFPLYRRGRMSLVVSGPGKTNAAAATAYLYAVGGCLANAAWVNVGIAGHAEWEVGQSVLAFRVTDAGSGLSWHPVLAPPSLCPSDALVTLDRPEPDYGRAELVDMEASGFCATAGRFATGELTQVLKVVSDNRRQPAERVDSKLVRRLIADSLDILDPLLARLGAHAQDLHETQDPEKMRRPSQRA